MSPKGLVNNDRKVQINYTDQINMSTLYTGFKGLVTLCIVIDQINMSTLYTGFKGLVTLCIVWVYSVLN